MAVYTGSGGTVTFSGAIVAASWSLTSNIELAEATALGASVKTYKGGFKDWTATVEMVYMSGTDTHAKLGTTAALSLYINGANYFEANAICTGLVVNSSIDDVIRATLTFEGTDGTATIAFN